MSNIHLCRNVTAAEINETTYNANTIGALLAAYRSTIMHSPKVQNMESEAVYRLIQRDLQKADKAYALITSNKLRPKELDSFIDVLKTLILSCMRKNKLVELCRVFYKEEHETECETVMGYGDDRGPPAVHSVPPDSIPVEQQPTNNTAVESLGCEEHTEIGMHDVAHSTPPLEAPQFEAVSEKLEYTEVAPYVPEVADVTPPLELPQPDGDTEVPDHEDGVEEQPSLEGSNALQALIEDGVEDQAIVEGSHARQHIGIQTKLPIADEDKCKGCSAGKELVEFCYTNRLDYCNVNMLKQLLHACFTNSSSEGDNCKKCEKVLEVIHNVEEMQLMGIQDDALYDVAKKAKKRIRASMKKSTNATVKKRKYVRKNKCPPKKTPKHDKKTLGPVASLYGRFAELDDEGNFTSPPPQCKLRKSPASVVQFARFMEWALKGHYKLHDFMKGKAPDFNGVNNEWRTKTSSCMFDVGCTSWLRLEHNKARLSSWIIPMRCVPGAFKSTELQFPKYTYQGSLWVEDISEEEKVSIAIGEEMELTPCVMLACAPTQDGTDVGLFIRLDDLYCLIQRMRKYCENLARRTLATIAETPEEKKKMAPNEIIGKGIFYNILARSLFPADSCGAILKYGTYSGTSTAKKNRSTSAGSSDDEDVQNEELQESPFVNFRFDCMFSLSPDGKRSPFVPGLMRSILTDEVRKLTSLRDEKLNDVMKDIIKKDASSFSTKPNVGIVTFKKWIKTCYEKQMRTIIGHYMQEMDCVSEEFQSFRVWLNDVYYKRHDIWPNLFGGHVQESFSDMAQKKLTDSSSEDD
ncbi:unnamed protein product [Notodromas monacha]|uniref:Uncharacterized protein n=1 Tax=Notodromas monacha TaxID=399045 RepID=A0A7R9GIY5_9CRUS|nr:unnamed protein product [Notodromas monacha]CAG0922311.1 unnamed protein product [Notodromas monacha]